MNRVLVLWVAFFLAVPLESAGARKSPETLRPLLDVIETIQENYAGDSRSTGAELMNAALSGMVDGLDRYSEYLDAERFKDMQEDTKGSFGGIGIEIGLVNNKLSVIAPIEGTPADKAGLQGGDYIMLIGGVPTAGMKLLDAVHRIKGPPGTSVTLTMVREGASTRDVSIVRGQIVPINVRWRVLEDVGYVTIRSFTEKTTIGLEEALSDFRRKNLKGMILDLRTNPGGLLNEAVRTADMFLPGGKLIVSTESRDPRQRNRYYSTEKIAASRLPLVILVNEHSASGSEIVAGALQDWDRAVIAGRRTFGKASVQSVSAISRDGSQALRLTVARYYTPKHREIHEVGIEPDVKFPVTRQAPEIYDLVTENIYNLFVTKLAGEPGSWLDSRALKEGELAPGSKGEDRAAFEDRVWVKFTGFCEDRSIKLDGDALERIREQAMQQVRIAAVRKAKGEEAARKTAVEFDPQVRSAVSLLKLLAKEKKPG